MKRTTLLIVPLVFLSLGWTASARAQDKVIFTDQKTGKETSLQGTIQTENAAGITIRQGTKTVTIAPSDVVRIDYKLDVVKPFQYKVAFGIEEEALKKKDTAERTKLLGDAQREFEKLAMMLARDNPMAYRYVQYRLALIPVQVARVDPTKREAAIESLKKFCTETSTGWEPVPGLKQLALLQEEVGDIAGAKETYGLMRVLPDLPKEQALESSILVANLQLRLKKFDEAEKTLQDAMARMADNDPQRPILAVHLCEAQMKQGKTKDIEKQLLTAIKNTSESNLLAVAHNTLGDYYRDKKQDEEAFWQYLRVDVLYAQDREEHARALFWLSKLFESVKKDKAKAQECLDKLKTDYQGTEYAPRVPADK